MCPAVDTEKSRVCVVAGVCAVRGAAGVCAVRGAAGVCGVRGAAAVF